MKVSHKMWSVCEFSRKSETVQQFPATVIHTHFVPSLWNQYWTLSLWQYLVMWPVMWPITTPLALSLWFLPHPFCPWLAESSLDLWLQSLHGAEPPISPICVLWDLSWLQSSWYTYLHWVAVPACASHCLLYWVDQGSDTTCFGCEEVTWTHVVVAVEWLPLRMPQRHCWSLWNLAVAVATRRTCSHQPCVLD